MSSSVVFSGKMNDNNHMHDENLYVCFPQGIANGNVAYVLGTWTTTVVPPQGKIVPLTLDGTCRFIAEKDFFIVKEGAYYRLKVNISGEKIDAMLVNKNDDPVSERSTLSKLS